MATKDNQSNNGVIIGIDLGTSNSCVAINEGTKQTVITNTTGDRTTPSFVFYKKDGERMVGKSAKNAATVNVEDTLHSAKRFIGRNYNEVKGVNGEATTVPYVVKKNSKTSAAVFEVNGKTLTPEEVSSHILTYLKQSAEEYLGRPVEKAVVTVPAYFNDSQRQSTVDAGKIAGLEVVRIINEPTAAALAYGLDKGGDKKIAVYDLGGGTFDVSILEIGDGVFEVLATNGDTHLGGDDFDKTIMNWILDEFKKDSGMDLSKDKQALGRIREAAEKTKIALSTAQSTDINLPFITADATGPKHLQMTMTASQLEKLCTELVEKSKKPCLNALKDAGISTGEIDEVILVGGMTRMPLVQQMVEKLFGKKPHKGVNPDEVVAVGASIQAGVLTGDVKDVLLLDVTPLSLGIETLGGVMTKLIDKNTTIPTQKKETFSTAADNQPAVTISVCQGESDMADRNKRIGQFNLEGIAPAPRGTPQIEVCFDIDANGILSVSAKDKGTGKEHKITITSASGLDENEIERLKKEAEENQEEDKKRKEEAEILNEADSLSYRAEKSLKDYGDKLPENVKNEIQSHIDALKESMKTKNIDDIKQKTQALNQHMQKIGEEMQKSAQAQQPQGDNTNKASANDENIEEADVEIVDEKEKK